MSKIWKVKHLIGGKQTYLFVCVLGALVSGRSVCELFRNVCGSCASSYNGLSSLPCCSVISWFCWRYICMYMFSQWFIFIHFLHGCISFSVLFAVPYSCLLFSMCVAHAEAGLLVWYIIYALYVLLLWACLTVQHNSYCMCYILFHILHLGSYCLFFVPVADIWCWWLWMLC